MPGNHFILAVLKGSNHNGVYKTFFLDALNKLHHTLIILYLIRMVGKVAYVSNRNIHKSFPCEVCTAFIRFKQVIERTQPEI